MPPLTGEVIMKFRETEFAKQLFAVVVGTLFFVAGVAAFTLPSALACPHAGTDRCRTAVVGWHLT
jgi:hypothetical protein